MELVEEIPESYLYHSFARPHRGETPEAQRARSLKVLRSILDHGILLSPERVDFTEGRSDGSKRALWLAQTRACFTLLEPDKLEMHSKVFGPISLEWEVEELQ